MEKFYKYKKIFIIAIVILGMIAIGIYVFVMQKIILELSDNQNMQNIEVGESQNYYDKLANKCKNKQNESCCLASVEAMRVSNYTLAPQVGCPTGYQPNMMRCTDSYRWCQPTENSINQVLPTTTQSPGTKVAYTEGQYIDGIWKVRERVQDCGGGESCLNYLTIQLPEEMSTDDIRTIRINVGSCVDKTLRTGDIARVRGIIEKVIPDIGLILSCNSSKTSVTKN